MININSQLMVTRYWLEFPKTSDGIRERMSEKYISNRSYTGFMSPSGRISIGALPKPKELKAEKEYEATYTRTSYHQRKHWDAFEGIVSEQIIISETPSPLGSSSAPNCHNPARERYGLRGITQNGRNKVYEGAKLLQRRYPGRLGFYTLTCPYVDPSRVYEFNRNISEIVRRWFQELRRMYDRKNCKFSYVSVLEIQSDRYEKSGIPVLHIHYVAPCYLPHKWEWILSATELRYLWMCLCNQIIGGEVDTSPSIDAQVVKRSASGYLAKYMAKGYSCVDWVSQICPSQLPKQWWSMSANVRKGISALTVQISEPLVEWWFSGNNFALGEPYHLTNIKEIYINWKGQELRVGLSAHLDKRGVAMFIPYEKWLNVMWTL